MDLPFPVTICSCGDIQIFDEKSREGIAAIQEMNEGENVVKKLLSNK